MDAEMRHHVECEVADRVARGMAPSEARRTALADFGGLDRFKEEGRDARGVRALEDLAFDVRYGLRVLRRHRGFTAATVLTFALGVGAATTIFSLVYGILLRPLPYADPDRLTVLWEHDLRRGHHRNVVAVANFEAWRDRSRSFTGMAALVPASVTMSKGGDPERVAGAEVSPGYFRLLGIVPALGREFGPGEEDVVVLSHGLWTRRFGGDRSVGGKAIPLRGRSYTIVGVMPRDFDPPRFGWLGDQELWLPFEATAENRSWGRSLLVLARLRPGVSVEQARAEMSELGGQLARESPSNAGWSVSVVGLTEQISGDARTSLLVLLGAVALLLSMAAANAAMLTLAFLRRSAGEQAIRRAIGAPTRRILQQLLTQASLLGALGTAAGLLAGAWGIRLLLPLLPPDLPRTEDVRVDGPVLLFGACAGLAATLVAGAAAALRSVRAAPSASLRERVQGRAAAPPGGGTIVIAEVALALVLTVLAGLMLRSFVALRAVDLGFTADHVVGARLSLPQAYATRDRQEAFFGALLERVSGIPGVRSAGLVSARPFGGIGPATTVSNPARPNPSAADTVVADVRFADAGFFRTLRIPVAAGSVFDDREPPAGAPRVLINETMARALWPGESPLGREVRIELFGGLRAEVLGVVSDVRLVNARTRPRATAYLPASRFPSDTRDVVVSGDVPLDALVASLRGAVAALEPALPLYRIDALDRLVEESLSRDRLTTFVLGAFAVAALALASVGIVGVFSAEVTDRRQEIGIRRALGAQTSAVMLLVLRRALARAAAGVAAGLLLSMLVARAMGSLLFGVGPTDPVSFLSVTAILFGVAGAAALIPAAIASHVSPLVAIRGE
jgi:putative ABC transport system permease protein